MNFRIAPGLLAIVALAFPWVSLLHAQPLVSLEEEVLQKAGIRTDTPSLLDFLRQRTPAFEDPAKIKDLIRPLDAQGFKEREEAYRNLAAWGARSLPFLRAALSDPSPEISRRAKACIRTIEDRDKEPFFPQWACADPGGPEGS